MCCSVCKSSTLKSVLYSLLFEAHWEASRWIAAQAQANSERRVPGEKIDNPLGCGQLEIGLWVLLQ